MSRALPPIAHRAHRAIIALTALAAFAAPAAPAEGAVEPWDPETHAPATVRAVRVGEPIRIDGELDEPVWNRTEPFELPFETGPSVNGPAPVRTFAWIAYDDDHLYFAFRAEDPDPAAIRARYSDRDRTFNDDQVGVILDTFHDGRRAFEFFVNPLGIQSDVLEDDVTGGDDPSWDAIWDSAGRFTASGFEVEGAVPFSSLRYPRATGAQVWGFNAVRFWPRDTQHRIALEPRDPNRNCLLCQLAELVGIEGLAPRLDVELDPTLTAARTERRELDPRGPWRSDDEIEVGLSARWGVTPNLSLNGTVNPDFSQVEADAQQLEVNQRFALFFPEKRSFFLEGADLFDTDLDLVHTRDIADPYWGLKLTGKEGDNAFGVLVAEDRLTNLLLPGSEGSSLASIDDDNLSSALRYRRDLPLAGSTFGVLYTGREGDSYGSHLYGADALLRFAGHHSLRVEAFGSQTTYPEKIAAEHGQPSGRFSDTALNVGYGFRSERWAADARWRDVGGEFRADLGFLPRVGYRRWTAGVERIWRGDAGDRWDEMRLGGGSEETRDAHGRLLELDHQVWWQFQGGLQSAIFVGPGRRREVLAGVEFDQSYLELEANLRPSSTVAAGLAIYAGDAVDFANVRPGEIRVVEPSLTLNPGRHLQLDLAHGFERLDVAGGELYRANLSRLTARWQLDRRTQIRLISQYLDVERAIELYADEVAARERRLTNQLLFSWKLNPQTVAFVGYSDVAFGDQAIAQARSTRTWFVKLGYAWLP
jgi:hypothetical protein